MRSAAAPQSLAVTPELVMQLRRPVEVELSPDGSRLAFTLSPVYREKGGTIQTRLWTGETRGEHAPLHDDAAAEALPRFSRDGSTLAYASDRGHAGRMTVWIEGRGELGDIAGSVEDVQWSPDGSRLLVLAADLGSDRAGAQTATKITEVGAEEEDPRVTRPAQHWRRLFTIDIANGDTREASPEGVNVFEFGWAGGKAVAVCSDEPSESAWYDAWIGLLDIDVRSAERIHDADWQLQSPRISPDGSRVAFIEGFGSDRGVMTGTVLGLELETGAARVLAPELDVCSIRFADDETLWYAGWRRAGSISGTLRVDGTYEELFAGDVTLGSRYQPRIAPSADGSTVAAVMESATRAPEVVLLSNGDATRLTELNAELEPKFDVAEWEAFTWTAPDGLEIEGLLARPKHAGSEPLPLAVLVHGGPTASWSWMFAPYFGLPWLLASEGHAVLMPNPRGSVGRGQEFARANLGDMGGGDLQDILSGIDALVDAGVVDDDRVSIMGGSYGGFMASWAVTQTDRFAAAVPMAVCTNWTSFHNTTNIGRFDALFLQADPYDPSGEYPKRSPVFHARNAKTPTLIMHGEDDLCTPLPQATEFYNALVEAGCETELVVYPREGHGWTEREHQIDGWNRIRDWLRKHANRGT